MNTDLSTSKNGLLLLSSTPHLFRIYYSLFFLLLFLASPETKGQNTILSSGKKFTNSGYSLSYSIGELSVCTYGNSNCFLTQGQQQGSLIVTSVNKLMNPEFAVKAYPNPTNSFVTISIEKSNASKLNFSLRTVTGSILQTQNILSELHKIDMSKYISGIYFLSVTDEKNSVVQTFKIIKQ